VFIFDEWLSRPPAPSETPAPKIGSRAAAR
jgi:hypothetical protein